MSFRNAVYALLSLAVGIGVGELWTSQSAFAEPAIFPAVCIADQTCLGTIVSGGSLCQTSADCQGKDDGVTFSACYTATDTACKPLQGATKGCGGTCQDAGKGDCAFTMKNCKAAVPPL